MFRNTQVENPKSFSILLPPEEGYLIVFAKITPLFPTPST